MFLFQKQPNSPVTETDMKQVIKVYSPSQFLSSKYSILYSFSSKTLLLLHVVLSSTPCKEKELIPILQNQPGSVLVLLLQADKSNLLRYS